MNELLRLVLDSVQFLFPLRRCWQWEVGAYYVCGRYWRTVGPGVYPVIPWFCDIKVAASALDTYTTPLQTITTKDGGSLTFSASIKMRVVDAAAAINEAVRYEETALEDASAALADRLAEVDANRLEPESRRALLSSCKDSLNRELGEYGVRIVRLRFTNFARNIRMYRLFGDGIPTKPSDYVGSHE